MKKLLAVLSATLLLSACGESGPKTVSVGSTMLTYDSAVWENFSNDSATGLGVKGDESCWIDLAGDMTKPLPEEGLKTDVSGAVTMYVDPTTGEPHYVAFEIGGETLSAAVSVDTPEVCVGDIMTLVDSNLGE